MASASDTESETDTESDTDTDTERFLGFLGYDFLYLLTLYSIFFSEQPKCSAISLFVLPCSLSSIISSSEIFVGLPPFEPFSTAIISR